MRWNIETWEEKQHRLKNWHKWWAWHPVTVHNSEKNRHQRAWLETVWRQGQLVQAYEYGRHWRWNYLLDPCDFELLKLTKPEEER